MLVIGVPLQSEYDLSARDLFLKNLWVGDTKLLSRLMVVRHVAKSYQRSPLE